MCVFAASAARLEDRLKALQGRLHGLAVPRCAIADTDILCDQRWLAIGRATAVAGIRPSVRLARPPR